MELADDDVVERFGARALGAARSGNPDAAKADIAKLAELRDRLRQANDAYWSEQVDIQWQVASAWVLYAEGKYEDAVKAMSAAADAEDKTEKHPVTPGVPIPARELFGTMLLERGMASEALTAFQATLKKEPRRLGATARLGSGRRQGPATQPRRALRQCRRASSRSRSGQTRNREGACIRRKELESVSRSGCTISVVTPGSSVATEPGSHNHCLGPRRSRHPQSAIADWGDVKCRLWRAPE
jgi:tetratricopeptide (TPR) repeat protein